jgi:hypothetical protein
MRALGRTSYGYLCDLQSAPLTTIKFFGASRSVPFGLINQESREL